MKNLRYIAIALIMTFPMILAGCMNDDFNESSPNSLYYKAYSGPAVNTTIKQLLTDYNTPIKNNSMALVKTGTIIEGTVISSDANGNFYQNLIIQDATGGLQINISEKGLHVYYPLGQKVVINCDSLWIGGYGKAAILGGDYFNTTKGIHQVGRLNKDVFETHATPDGTAFKAYMPNPKEISKYTDLTTADINTLVTLKNVSFDDAQYRAFAPEEEQDGGYAVDRNVSFSNDSYIVLRTSSYANFAKKALPGGTGDITGVMGYYSGTYQFIIRDYTADLSSSFVQYNNVRTPLYSEPFSTSLGKMTPLHVTNDAVTDISDWAYTQYGATVSGYDKTAKVNKAVVSYLVSPTIDLTNVKNAFVSFSGAIAFGEDKNVAYMHQLLVSSDYSGDPSKATWTVMPFNAKVSKYTFINTGKIGVPTEYIGKKVTFALRYKSSTSSASTWEVKNFMVDEGLGEYYALPELPIYSNTLLSNDGGFTAYSVTGTQTWSLKNSYGFKISGFASNKNNINEDWAVSSAIDLAGAEAPKITFDHAINYAKGNPFVDLHTFWISDNFSGDVTTATWTQLTIPTYPTGADWTYVSSGEIAVPATYIGKKVYIAFKYKSDATVATTWEIKNLVIK